MGYYITTWEDVEKAHDEWEDSECERSEKLDDYAYELECFAEHVVEGLYCSKKFHKMERLTNKELLEKAKQHTLVFFKGTAEEPILISQEDADDEKRILESLIKLTKLEDIEEELGIDLITLFKAIKNGIYVKSQNIEVKGFGTFETKSHLSGSELHLVELVCGWALQVINPVNDEELIQEWLLKEYKTEWFLTKEELEKQK